MKNTVMNDENRSSDLVEPAMRITRARAKALGSSSRLPSLYPSAKPDGEQVRQTNSKREAPSSTHHKGQKKRAVLRDVTNITCEKLYMNCMNAARHQDAKDSLQKKARPVPFRFAKNVKVSGPRSECKVAEMNKAEELQEISSEVNSKFRSESINSKFSGATALTPTKTVSSKHGLPVPREGSKLSMTVETLEDRGIINIDKKHTDLQMCSLYAANIYTNLYAKEVDQRPLADYMEKLQKDINQGMRGILIDWLVEVSEEYRLVPDTLYLTVNLLDRYLSENYMEKQKLQLLGVTCMLISSKYEEICAPRVEEFCFITDNTYTKEEVVKMESCVLNFLRFQLSAPTAKKFLRRFIQAAQVSYEVPSVELEYLANYLAELTLVEYSFLKFLPSLIAASAVFLARWTLDQSEHPWNLTLEHYTRYKTVDLKTAVHELQDLQLNTKKCMLNVIREKYKQPKFKAVSTLRSSESIQFLFQ